MCKADSKKSLEHICETCDHGSCPWIHYEKSKCAFYGVVKEDLDRLEELEKVIDILRNKTIHYNGLCFYDNVEMYNGFLGPTHGELTEEEFNLLRKVFWPEGRPNIYFYKGEKHEE